MSSMHMKCHCLLLVFVVVVCLLVFCLLPHFLTDLTAHLAEDPLVISTG